MVRDQVGALRDGMQRRGKLDTLGPLIDRAEQLDRDRRSAIQAVEEKKAQRNAASQEVARRKRAKENADALVADTRLLGDEIAAIEQQLAATQSELDGILLEIPNVTLDDVPAGDESAVGASRARRTASDRTGKSAKRLA
jgi:seryl-tRNA synthetase